MKAKDLKNAILQMAVQGALVPQDPSDEPASALLDRIREERAELIKEKKTKTPRGGESVIYRAADGSYYEKCVNAKGHESEPVCIDDEIPFDIPETWEWARLGNLCDFGTCKNIEYTDVIPGTWNLDLEDIERDTGKYLRKKRKVRGEKGSTKHVFKCDMVLYSKLRPYLNKVIIADEDGVCTSEILPLSFEALLPKYAQIYFMSPMFLEYANTCSYGVKMPRLGTKDGKAALAPVPPLAEQHRIVKRISELVPLVEEYGKLENAREKLDAELPDKLHKSVLQMAVQGTLVPQDPSDEPASSLLEHIREERAELIRENKIKTPKGGESVIYRTEDGSYYEKRIDAKGRETEPVCINAEIPFEIPRSWKWVRLCTVVEVKGGKRIPAGRKLSETPTSQKYIRISDMSNGTISESNIQYLPEDLIEPLQNYTISSADIFITVAGTIGRVGIVPIGLNGANLTENADKLILSKTINKEFLVTALNSPYIQSAIANATTQVGQPKLAIKRIESFLLALPPLPEQHRIVKRVAKLMPLIDDLGKLDSEYN